MFTYDEMENYLAETKADISEKKHSDRMENKLEQSQEENERLRREKWESREKIWKMQKKRERRLRRQCMVLGAATILLAASAAFSVYYDNRVANTSSGITKVGGDSTGLYGADDESTYEEPRIMTQQDAEVMNLSENLLILVNKDNPLPENFEVELHYLNNGSCAVAEIMYDALAQMLSDGSDEGLSFVVASGYRDTQEQRRLLETLRQPWNGKEFPIWKPMNMRRVRLCRRGTVSMRPGWRWILCRSIIRCWTIGRR